MIDAIVRQCAAHTGRPEADIWAEIQPYLRQAHTAALAQDTGQPTTDPDQGDIERATIAVLELLQLAETAHAAEALLASGNNSLPALTRITARVATTDRDAAAALLDALAERDNPATVRDILDTLAEADAALAERVRSRCRLPPEAEPIAEEGQTAPTILDIDPTVFIASRRAALIRHGQVTLVCDELGADDETPPSANVVHIADIEPDGVQLAGILLTQMLRVGRTTDVVDAVALLLERDLGGPRQQDAVRSLLRLAPRDLRTVVLGVATVADPSAIGHLAAHLNQGTEHLPSTVARQLLIDLVLATTSTYPDERACQATRVVFAVLPAPVVLEVLRSPVVLAVVVQPALSGTAAALLEALPAGMVKQLVHTDLGAAVVLVSRTLDHASDGADSVTPHAARIAIAAEILYMSRSHAEKAADLLAHLIIEYPSAAAILLNIGEGDARTIEASATLLSRVLLARPGVVNAVVALGHTAPGLPTQVFNEMVRLDPGTIEPVLRALVAAEDGRAEVQRMLLLEEARVNPELCLRLLNLLAEYDPAGPWGYAADKLNNGDPKQVAPLISAAQKFTD